MINFGVIGCGNISRFHFEGIKQAGSKVTYICDVNEKVGKSKANELDAIFTADYKDVVTSPNVDVVLILTSGKFHKEICEFAINNGKNIICEKTMMDNPQDAEYIAKLAQEKGVLFFTAFMKRFFPASQKMKELMQSIGTIFSSQIRSYQSWGNLYDNVKADDWSWTLSSYGGAVVKCAGSHMLDMMMFILGRPINVYANIGYIPTSKIDRQATALFEYNEFAATFETIAHPLKKIGYERNSWDEYMKVYGTKGSLELYTVMWDSPENNAALLIHYDNETQTSTEYRFDKLNPFTLQTKFYVECLENGTNTSPNEVDGANVDIVIGAMFESNDKRKPVAIDWRGL